jgi:hypothetical protein
VFTPAPCSPPPTTHGRRVMSDKINTQHLARKAILYIRQSSTYQVSPKPRKLVIAVCDAGPFASLGVAGDRGRG